MEVKFDMNENEECLHAPPLGNIETHKDLLEIPPDKQLLYKIMSVENFLSSIAGNYLHFNRVDSYEDFPGADEHDGEQPPMDREANARMTFEKAPDFSVENYFDKSRERTYACCFSLCKNYAKNNNKKGNVCVVFEFGKLRAMLNSTLKQGNSRLIYNGLRCHQIFGVNYGKIKYVTWETARAERQNPILCTYYKDFEYSEEKELRISLSAIGIGEFILNDKSTMPFSSSLSLSFDFRAAIADKTILRIELSPESDFGFLQTELSKLRIVPSNERTFSVPLIQSEIKEHINPI